MLVYKRVDRSYPGIDRIATWHNEIPLIWDPTFIAARADIQKTIRRIEDMPDTELYLAVAEDCGNAPQAFIWAYRMVEKPDAVMILSLYTDPLYRGKGVARTLKSQLEDWCRAEGITKIVTTVHYKNQAMIDFNVKMGYETGMVTMCKSIVR